MAGEIKFHFIGWCKGVKNGVTSDKVWTAFEVDGNYYAGWGARGKKIRFKQHPSYAKLMSYANTKRKDYDEVDKFELFMVFPDFEDDVHGYLTFAILGNEVM